MLVTRNAIKLAYYDPAKKISLQVDASKKRATQRLYCKSRRQSRFVANGLNRRRVAVY